MTDILRCLPFQHTVSDYTFSSSGFALAENSKSHIYALAEAGLDEFLYLIAGLQNFRGNTKAAQRGRVVREESLIPTAELEFLELLGRPLYQYHQVSRAQ